MRWRAVYALVACATSLLPWLPRWLPTVDGPQHLRLIAFVLEMRADAQSPLHGVFEDALGVRTASSFAWFCVLLHPWLSLETAERLWASACILGFALVGCLWTRALRPEEPGRALLLTPFFINWFTTQGFWPFLGSVPCAGLALWLLYTGRTEPAVRLGRVVRVTAAAALLVATYLGHISTLLIALGVGTAFAWMRVGVRRRALIESALAFAPALALMAVVSFHDFAGPVTTHGEPRPHAPFFPPLYELLALAFVRIHADVGPVDRWLQGLAFGLIGFLALLALVAQARARRPVAKEELGDSPDLARWPLGVAGLLFIALLALPVGWAGGWHVSARVLPFILLILPAAVSWPRAGSRTETWLGAGLALGALVVLISVGVGWTHLGDQLDRVARAGAVMEPGTRLAWLGFEPEADAPYGVRGTALLRHAWAIPARERRQLVAFGFENFRHSMVRARRDARPPLPEGANEFSAILWDEALKPPPFVYLERHFSTRNITSAARLLLPTLAAPDILPRLRQAVLSQAGREFHYLLVGNPPAAVANEIRNFEWPRVYQDGGVEVYRLGRALDDLSLGGTARPPGRPAGKRRASTHPESAAGSGDGADATSR